MVLAAIQAIGIIAALNSGTTGTGERVLQEGYNSFFGLLSIGVIMAAGTSLAMWIGERVTQNGIGNGISLLIFAGIISNLFSGILTAFTDVLGITHYGATVSSFLILVLTALVIITVVTFIDLGERRIPVQYAKRVVGRKMYGGQSTHIPMKIVSVGVLPLDLCLLLHGLPRYGDRHVRTQLRRFQVVEHLHASGSPLNLLVTALLIVAFTYFYASISFNPQDIAKNIQQQGGNIPGIRSGQNTVAFLARIARRLTLFAAIFLAALATLPTLLSAWQNVRIPFAASSMLIAVSVSLETVRQVEAQLVMRNYKGFL